MGKLKSELELFAMLKKYMIESVEHLLSVALKTNLQRQCWLLNKSGENGVKHCRGPRLVVTRLCILNWHKVVHSWDAKV